MPHKGGVLTNKFENKLCRIFVKYKIILALIPPPPSMYNHCHQVSFAVFQAES